MPVQSRALVAVRVAIPVLTVGVYLCSLAAPTDNAGWLGIHLFLIGLLFCWALHLMFSWWANVFYWIALGYYCRGNWPLAAKWGMVATGLAMSALFLAGMRIKSPAFQLWTASMAMLAAGSLAIARWPGRHREKHGERAQFDSPRQEERIRPDGDPKRNPTQCWEHRPSDVVL
jgi:hypothetical protein